MKTTLIALLGILTGLSCYAESGKQERRTYVVGFAQDTMSNDWRAAQVNEMKQALAPYDFIKFVYKDAEGDALRQANDLQILDQQNVDFLVTSPRNQAIMTPVISSINKHKPVILLSRKTLNNEFTSFAGANDESIARKAASFIAEKLNGKGKVVMLSGVITATTAIARRDGFLEEIRKYPEIEVVASPIADYLRHKAIQEMDKLIQAGVMFDAIYSHSDSMASGARMSMERNGLEPEDFIIVGIDFIPEAKAAIKAGKQTASFTYPTAGKQGAEIILKLIRGEKIEKNYNVPFEMVTADNVEQVPSIFE